MFKATAFGILFLLTACNNYAQLHPVTELPNKLDENSGMVTLGNNSYWFINDSGGKEEIYEADEKGKLVSEVEIKDAKNIDWEDLAIDDKKRVYIGDFGNNAHKRGEFQIYVIDNPAEEKDHSVKADKITFTYPEPLEGSKKKKKLYDDCEAFFYFNNSLYIFTKDRSSKYKGICKLYRVPAKPGDYTAEFIGTYEFGGNYNTGSITAATISPDHKKVVLLTHRMLYIFEDFEGDNFFTGKLTKLDMEHESQKESVCFKNERTLIISDEAGNKGSAVLYEYQLP